MIEGIRNVVFDLGGVLVPLNLDRCKKAFIALGMPQIAEIIDPCHPAAMIRDFERGDITAHEMCEEMRRVSGRHEITDEAIAKAYTAFIEEIPSKLLRLIDRLRIAGYRTYILSNNNPIAMKHIRGLFAIEGRNMTDYFDRIYLSYEQHELKPDVAIFRKMIADSGIIPEETLFIDDSAHNLTTAQQLGFAVYQPDPNEDFSHLFEMIK